MGKQPTRQQVAAVLTAIGVLLGAGTGAGYALRPADATPPPPLERVAALEKWQAAEIALKERDRAERAELIAAIRDQNATNGAVRDAVIALNERMGAYDARLRLVEVGGVRPASGKR